MCWLSRRCLLESQSLAGAHVQIILFLFGQILERCALARLRPRLILKHFPSQLRGVISHGFSSLQRAGFAVMQCSLSWLNAENTHAARRIGSDQRQLKNPLIRNYQTYFLIKAKARLLEAVTSDIIDITHIKQCSCSVLPLDRGNYSAINHGIQVFVSLIEWATGCTAVTKFFRNPISGLMPTVSSHSQTHWTRVMTARKCSHRLNDVWQQW